MRKLILAATTIAALAVPAVTAVPAMAKVATTTDANGNVTNVKTGDVTCYGDLTSPVAGDLNVPAGASCKVMWTEVNGDTTVEGALSASAGTFDGKVKVDGGSFASFNYGATIHGSLKITGSSAQNGFWSDYGPTVIDGQFKYLNNSGPLYMEGSNTVFGKFTYSGNSHLYSGTLVTHGHSNIS